jgi:tetratricopeptide (TPR) repeat protein
MLMLLVAVLLLPGVAQGQLRHGDPIVTVVNHDAPNVRSTPRVSRETLIGTVARGTQLKRIGREGRWHQVVLPDGRSAWLYDAYAEEGTARDLLEVRPAAVNVRRSASTRSERTGVARRGETLRLDLKRGNWYRVITADGKKGWIREDMVILRPLARREAEPDPSPETETPPKAAAPPVDPYQKGLDLVAEDRLDAATKSFQEALKADPDNGAAHFELAKLLRGQGNQREALDHFRKALRGKRRRPEAQMYIDAILRVGKDSVSVAAADADTAEAEAGAAWFDTVLASATYLLPAIALASLVFLIVLGVIYRRRRSSRVERPVYKRRKADAGFEAVLKYAVEKRPLQRKIEEAEQKRAEMDEALQRRFDAFGEELEGGRPKLPTIESTETLMKRVDGLRQTILNQEERAQIYADMVVLQNEKIAALDEEIQALKKLIQLDYRDRRKETKQAGASPKKARGK